MRGPYMPKDMSLVEIPTVDFLIAVRRNMFLAGFCKQ